MSSLDFEMERWAFGGSESANPQVTAMVRMTGSAAIVVAKGKWELSRGLPFLCPDCETSRVLSPVFILS